MSLTETAVVVPELAEQADPTPNPLISAQKSSDIHAVLHPLVLLNISDYITRHTLRNQQTPIVGALVGQQNGRDITIEHAFDAHLDEDDSVPGGWLLQQENFGKRVEQMRTVHKDRSLELVGWYTTLPRSGPSEIILPIHNQILTQFNESAILLGFHGTELGQHRVGGKLPIVIYESNYEVDEDSATHAEHDGEDTKMDDGEQPPKQLRLRFRELPYSVEMSDAEMISMNHVAQGGANASLATPAQEQEQQQQKKIPVLVEARGKGKRRAVERARGNEVGPSTEEEEEGAEEAEEEAVLSPAEEDMIAALTGKASAIRMLQSRINLIVSYLDSLSDHRARPQAADEVDMPDAPPADATKEGTPQVEQSEAATKDKNTLIILPSAIILRRIQALVTRLDLVVPSDIEAFRQEMQREQNDVALIELLDSAVSAIHDAWGAGMKFSVIEAAKRTKRDRDIMGGGGNFESPWLRETAKSMASKVEERLSTKDSDFNTKGALDQNDHVHGFDDNDPE